MIQLSIAEVIDLPRIKLSNNNSFITWNNTVLIHRKYYTYSRSCTSYTHTYIGTIMIQLSIAEIIDLPWVKLSNNNSFITWNNTVLIHRKYYTYSRSCPSYIHTYIWTIMVQLSIAEVIDLPCVKLSNNNSFITWNNTVLVHRKCYT